MPHTVPNPAPSAAHLLSAPLDELLSESGATIVESPIHDEKFLGAITQRRRGGPIRLMLPAGWSPVERDTLARFLLGKLLGIELSDLPAPLTAVSFQAVA